jgi:Rrf2 family protein
MRMPTKVLYSVQFMVDLALYGQGNLVLLKDVCRRQGISMKYLGHFIPLLKSAGLITALRGASGGFTLARPATEITVKNIIEAVEGQLCLSGCTKDASSCRKSGSCAAEDFWGEATDAVSGIFDSYSLAHLADLERNKNSVLTYSI